MHARAAAQFPQPGIRLVVAAYRLLSQMFETVKQRFIAAPGQALVEEDVGGGKNGRTVDVVLHLAVGQIADAHRPHAAIACQRGDLPFVQFRSAVDAVDRLQQLAARIGGDIDDVGEVAFHGAGRAQPVQRVDHEIAVAQPAVAVIPVASAACRFRDGGGHGGDDGAGVVIGVQLERDRGADHGLLPFEGNAERAHPLAPVLRGFLQKAATDFAGSLVHGFVRARAAA